MRIRRLRRLIVPVMTMTLAAGCQHCGERRPLISSYPPCERCQTQPQVRLVPQPPPQPQPFPGTPPPAPLPPGPVTQPPSDNTAQAPVWKPATPEFGNEPSARLYPPENKKPLPTTPPLSIPPMKPAQEPPKEPAKEPEGDPSAFPVDIPQFVSVKDQIATGLKPRPDGLTWLKERGYRTVLYLKAPGEDDTATRRLVESKGLTYQALEVSPETIKQGLIENFNRQLATPNTLPIFVYDKDGTLAGAVWFLYFQVADKLTREKTLDELNRLGYKPDEQGAQKDLWLAVQSYLSTNKAMSWQR